MALFRKTLTAHKLLSMVAQGANPRIIDLRGNYRVAIPGSIPVQFDPDIFFEEEEWVQDMLGVRFHPHQTIVILCEFGQSSEVALDLFMEKNPRTRFDIRTLKGGMVAYQAAVEKWTKDFKNREVFREELLSLATHPSRFHQVVKGIKANQKSFFSRLFG